MDEKEYFLRFLESFEENLPPGKFYNPDGLIPPRSRNTVILPNDRLLFVVSGSKCEPMSIGGKYQEIQLYPGDCYLVRKNIWEAASRSQVHTLFYIMLRGGFLRLALHSIKNANDPWDQPLVYHTAMLSESLTKAFSLLKSIESGEIARQVIRLIIQLTIEEVKRSSSKQGKAQKSFEHIRDYLELHYQEPITRESVAKYFGFSASYISQIFQKFTGHSFNDYLTECRINQAKFLLIHTAASIKEIADECGFSSYIYFVRRFRECVGMSPGNFRIQNQ